MRGLRGGASREGAGGRLVRLLPCLRGWALGRLLETTTAFKEGAAKLWAAAEPLGAAATAAGNLFGRQERRKKSQRVRASLSLGR